MTKVKIIGKLTDKEINHRITRTKRITRTHGILLGSVIITGIKGIPGVSWGRCNIRRNKESFYAVKNGVFIRFVSVKVLKDKSFKSI